MTAFNHDAFMSAWRGLRDRDGRRIATAEYELIMAAIAGRWRPTLGQMDEPAWMAVARKLIGTREIPGPAHTSFIAKGWARLGAAWFNDDETPWCGLFVAHCIDAAGLEYPGKGSFARAKAWLDWGRDCPPVLGAIVVFGRNGGGHVGFLAGESATNYYVLGGNQGNAVNIAPIAKARALGCRWPATLPHLTSSLPRLAGGKLSENEA